MAEAVDRPSLHEVEIALARVIPEVGARAADEHGLGPRGDVHQRIERMGGVGHGKLLMGRVENGARKAGRPHFAGAAFSKTWAELANQRWRRTWRNPSSSLMRRRKAARRWVREEIMGRGHTTEGSGLSSGACCR